MKKSKFFWFLILMVAIHTYILLSTHQRLNGGACELVATNNLGCFGVNYWHSVIGLGLAVFYVFKEKTTSISLARKWVIAIVLMALMSLFATWIFIQLAIAYLPVTIILILSWFVIMAVRKRMKDRG